MKLLSLLAALVAVAAPAAASAAIVIEHPEIRPTLGALGTTAAYLTIRNTGVVTDRLVEARCACAASVMAHRTLTMKGVSHMQMEPVVAISGHDKVVFDARGRHLMLIGVKAPIRAGAKVPIVLTFEKAGRITALFTATDLAGLNDQHAH